MARILNFGSLNLDYVYEVAHFVCAGETLSSTNQSVFCGGKGLNQSIALARAGAQVFHAGNIGNDGDALLHILKENGVGTDFVRKTEGASGHAIIQREPNGQNCILLYGGANQQVDAEQVENTFSGFSAGDYLILQNEINQLPMIMKAAKEKGMRIVLNPSPMDEKILALPLEDVDIFMLNEVEGAALCKDACGGAEMLAELQKRFPTAAIVLTLGKDGVLYADPQRKNPLGHGIYQVPVVDTTAAGDTFTGFFIACISAGESVEQALKIASRASSIAVSRAGAAPSIPTMEEVHAAENVKP